jgi:hypothetical protein
VPQVFLSYRQLDDAQRLRVRSFADRVSACGIDVVLDQLYKETNPGGPPEGWPKWSSDQAISTERVLIIGNAPWFRCFDGKESPGTGLGAACEAGNIRQRLYDLGGYNEIIRVVYFDRADVDDISFDLKRYDRFHADDHFDDIIAWLGGTLSITAPSTASTIPWPAAVVFPPNALADRKDTCAFFSAMLTGATPESVACVMADSGTGKSHLLDALQASAAAALAAPNRVAHVRNLQEHTVDGLVETLSGALGGYACFPSYKASVKNGKSEKAQHIAFLDDLCSWTTPALIILDTWDKATHEVRKWITDHLLPGINQAPGLKLVLAGQLHVDFPAAAPSRILHIPLANDIPRSDWHEFIDHRYPADATALKPIIDRCLTKAHGVKAIAHILEIVEKGARSA